MSTTMKPRQVETEGNEVSTSFQADKRLAVKCWRETVDAAGLDDKVLAVECGMSPGYYSKVANGEQGDLIGLAYRLPRERATLRAEFFARLADSERIDLSVMAAEQLAVAAIRFLRTAGPIKASLGPSRKSEVA